MPRTYELRGTPSFLMFPLFRRLQMFQVLLLPAHPIELHFGPLRTFVIAGSDHPHRTLLAHRLHDYLRWRNVNARQPVILTAQRRERARVRSERASATAVQHQDSFLDFQSRES